MIRSDMSRKNIMDNNNYINKNGVITHVCPVCGNLYQSTVKLSVDVSMSNISEDECKYYKVTTPDIKRVCSCGHSCTIQVDNAMGIIIKKLIEKGYEIIECCEGHIYNVNGKLFFSFPTIRINESNVPETLLGEHLCFSNNTNFEISLKCKHLYIDKFCPCQDFNTFNQFKETVLKEMLTFVDSLDPSNVSIETRKIIVHKTSSLN